jgi:hypothetical protein
MKKRALFNEAIFQLDDDSSELTPDYYITKLRQLEYVLDQLNFLDHPVRIQQICQHMVKIKKELKRLEADKKNQLDTHLAN